jgi:hypothetical protein
MPRPNFLIIGAMKAGTTSLHKYLHEHDQVYVTFPKELHYFDREPGRPGGRKWSGPIADDATYEAFFDTAGPGHTALGEVSPSYGFIPIALRRIHEYQPDIKLIMIMRDPVTRAISHIRQRAWKLDEPLTEWGELVADIGDEPTIAGADWWKRRRGYHARGRYHEQLDNVFSLFSREQVLLMRLEDLAGAPMNELKRLTDFIGVDPFPDRTFEAHNTRDYEKPDPDIVEYLRQYYRPHNQLLLEKHGVSIDGWT